MKKQKLLFIIILFIFFMSIFYSLYLKRNQKELLTDNCERVQVFSYGGDIVGCREFKDSMPENAQDWCNQRFEKWKKEIPEYQQYQNMKCKLIGMSTYPAEEGALGCTEYCDYTCCK